MESIFKYIIKQSVIHNVLDIIKNKDLNPIQMATQIESIKKISDPKDDDIINIILLKIYFEAFVFLIDSISNEKIILDYYQKTDEQIDYIFNKRVSKEIKELLVDLFNNSTKNNLKNKLNDLKRMYDGTNLIIN